MPRKPADSDQRPVWLPSRFNEAAARCRGNRERGERGCRRLCSFNEAAARCRGNLFVDVTSEGHALGLQ